ncbi:MAG: DNA methyltransferase, partial [Betaproteobacteria bacterium]|nr:DNA methyltransferase [Betaproteobacteria bacterium]
MADNAIFKDYLAKIEHACKAGNATEHTHRPALKDLLEAFQPGIIATNEPKRIKCGAPDYIITRKDIPLGFVEAKDIGVSLDDTESGEQLRRYRDSLANLILTDYLEFRWYVSGELRLTARLAKPQASGKLRAEANGSQQLAELLQSFFAENIPVVSSPKELATRMAALARLIRSIIGKTFAEESEHGALHEQMEGFRKVLLHDLTAEQFGDMYAQTICYGLFAARCNSTGGHFTRTHAAYDLPKTNPFLRKLFAHIAGPELDERIVWAVDNLAELLNRADIAAILQDFGRATKQEDPVVHFYETFLGAYDQKMREARGVYYTPEPVVSYIVRSVDAILKKDFKLRDGLADASKVKLTRPKQRGKGTETIETHKVQILDPATGTGTFLYSVIGQIYQTFAGNKGMWPGYVQENLLLRLYGFE